MNKLSTPFLLLLVCASFLANAQGNKTTAFGFIDFEHPYFTGAPFNLYSLSIVAGSSNVWQIGKPQKTVFTSANSVPNVIVTDTVNSYPINDTSRFLITQVVNGSHFPLRYIRGKYRVYSDTLIDYGLIEVSADSGNTWINALTDTLYAFFDQAMFAKPILSGNSNGWKDFGIHLSTVSDSFHLSHGDMLLVRFSFISDGIQTNKDGLMFDDIYLYDYAEGIANIYRGTDATNVYPNPATDVLCIQNEAKYKHATVQLYSTPGVCTGSFSFANNEPMKIKLDGFTAGLYYYKVVYDGGTAFSDGKFVVEK